MSTEENKSVIRRFHGEVFSQGNLALIDELCDVNWTIVRIANGKIMDDWANFDLFGMLQQLGAIPTPR